ncbi:helix-turn-helix domain-containing protein, partial [Streptomyces sp. PH10-H1]|nr:helix-turn-helix domain-containing protein [Streptomyces sp. PH10-H1]
MATPQLSAVMSALPEDAPRAGVIHVRHRHTDRYTVVGNHLAQHSALSLTAIGLAVHIQSLPDGSSVTAKALTLRFFEGETTIRRALNELEEAGYLEGRRIALGGGRIATRTFSYDKPGCTRPPAARQPPPAGPGAARFVVGE